MLSEIRYGYASTLPLLTTESSESVAMAPRTFFLPDRQHELRSSRERLQFEGASPMTSLTRWALKSSLSRLPDLVPYIARRILPREPIVSPDEMVRQVCGKHQQCRLR